MFLGKKVIAGEVSSPDIQSLESFQLQKMRRTLIQISASKVLNKMPVVSRWTSVTAHCAQQGKHSHQKYVT